MRETLPTLSFSRWLTKIEHAAGVKVPKYDADLAEVAWHAAMNNAARVAINRDALEVAADILRGQL